MNKISKILWGGILVALGLIFGLNALGVADINIFFPGWWTLFIIVPCFVSLFTDSDKIGSLFGIIIGVLLLAGCQDWIDFDMIWRLFIPIALIMIGLKIIFKSMMSSDKAHKISQQQERKQHEKIREGEVVDDHEHWSVFSSQNIDYQGKDFDGCRLETVFGSMKLDLRGAKIAEDSVVKVSSIFGGVKIFVDESVNLEVSSTSIFGGVTNNHKNSDENKKTLYIDASCVFGGVEIQ